MFYFALSNESISSGLKSWKLKSIFLDFMIEQNITTFMMILLITKSTDIYLILIHLFTNEIQIRLKTSLSNDNLLLLAFAPLNELSKRAKQSRPLSTIRFESRSNLERFLPQSAPSRIDLVKLRFEARLLLLILRHWLENERWRFREIRECSVLIINLFLQLLFEMNLNF